MIILSLIVGSVRIQYNFIWKFNIIYIYIYIVINIRIENNK